MASYLLLFTGVLSALSASSHSLSCIECRNASESCTGPAVTCPHPDQICLSVYMLTSIEGTTIAEMFTRECGDRATCRLSGSFSIPIARTQTSASCCDSDGCTPEKPVLPSISNEKNGVRCKSCWSLTDGWCETSEYMECTGKEVKCFKQSQTFIGSTEMTKSSMRGCITKEMCVASNAEESLREMDGLEISCSDGCTSLHYSLSLLPLTIGLIIRGLY